ncbi:GNAT family N-acetyltransferase [Flagellimonas nanhaiensis]|uniref:GNAT family N-acetyltransferase n=1 Tax=Flagellimonas nanhaiensis TaxID=2292706 RepID=A0A371JU30_9FLAO|nr:GNAT family N-acetyltransferase [Allomuricauda nanhaiensis]RDY61297.1 GNAT family N-acetyltransferase [Allomuricauda nanhaiensis]
MTIRKASLSDLELIVPLFDAYRVFYSQVSDIEAARAFIKERYEQNETVILLALEKDKPVGFTQLYKTFSSVSLKPFYILNDLYVSSDHRKKGVGEALLNEAKKYCESKNFKGLALETATDNPAQKLYERLGWKKDEAYFHYFWENSKFKEPV